MDGFRLGRSDYLDLFGRLTPLSLHLIGYCQLDDVAEHYERIAL